MPPARPTALTPPTPLPPSPRTWLALTLTASAGSVDAIGYVTLYSVFTAHMSGNSIAAAVHAAQGKWAEAWNRAFPVCAFIPGLIAGSLAMEFAYRAGRRHLLATGLLIEAALLAAALLLSPRHPRTAALAGPVLAPVALLATAMGVQSVSLRRVGAVPIATTFITGILTTLAEEFATYLVWLTDHLHAAPPRLSRLARASSRNPAFRESVFLTCLFLAYVGGALVAASAALRFGPLTLLGPLALVCFAAAVDFIKPFPAAPHPNAQRKRQSTHPTP